jgi:hypothetical protein
MTWMIIEYSECRRLHMKLIHKFIIQRKFRLDVEILKKKNVSQETFPDFQRIVTQYYAFKFSLIIAYHWPYSSIPKNLCLAYHCSLILRFSFYKNETYFQLTDLFSRGDLFVFLTVLYILWQIFNLRVLHISCFVETQYFLVVFKFPL